MKSYDDITERVFRRGNEILEKKRKRTAVIKRTSLAISGMCAAVLVCFGIWQNNDIKNSVNDFHDKSHIITENDNVPTITTEYSQQTDLSETSTTSVNVTNIPILSTMTTQIVTSENTVISTTILNPVYSANSTETQTKSTETKMESLYETTQTILSTTTAFQINSTETNTVFCTQTTTISENTDREGGFYMKKLTSFFTSAVVLAASATPIIGHAEYNIDTSRYWPGEKAMFAKMDSGELDTDIDGNGVVDALDGYLLECYCFDRETSTDLKFNIPDDISSRIKVIADYNSDGEVDNDDTTSWVRHFIANRNLKAELFDYDYYVSEYVSETDESYISDAKRRFMSDLYRNMEYLLAGYDVVSDMYQKGMIDLDANGNGQLDIGDAYDFYIYLNAGRAVMAFPTINFVEVENVYISDDEWNYCDNVFETYASVVSKFKSPYSSTTASNDNFIRYVMLCIVENIELKSEYFTEEYYMETYGENYYATPYSMIVSSYVKQAAGELGLEPNEREWLKFNTDDLYEFFDSYCDDVESGLRSAPDVDMDGVVDYNDYFASNIYFGDLLNSRTADDSILPADIWYNLEQNCDFNGNGTSKDIYDILTVQLYVVKYVDRIDDFNDAYNKYAESLGGTSEFSFNEISYEGNVNILSDFEMKSNAVYGDANEDGEVNIADATIIIQTIGNKDKYVLSKQGEINADCYNTGDGVTGLDALAIQKLEANMISSLPYNEST